MKSSELTVAEIPDLSAYARLSNETASFLSKIVWRSAVGPESMLHKMIAGHTVVALDNSANVLGAGVITLDNPHKAVAEALGVSSDHQRLGIGSMLIESLETIAASHGATTMELTPAPGSMPFYKQIGYSGFKSDGKGFSIYKSLIK